MPTSFAKIARMKSVRIGFKKKPEVNDHPSTITPEPSQSNMMPINPIVPKTTTDDTFFFNDLRCQNRALFMTARIKQTLDHPLRPRSSYGNLRDPSPTIVPTPSLSTPTSKHASSVDSFWRTIAHRLYTLNYILFILPSHSHARADFLNKMEAELSLKSDGQELQRRGGMESHFAVRYALEHKRPRRRKTLLEDAFEAEKRNGGNVAGAVLASSDETLKNDRFVEEARRVIEECLKSESQLTHKEKDFIYVDQSRIAGLYDAFELRIELEEDRTLRHRLKRMVDHQKTKANPFEDQDLIVLDDEKASSRQQVDSGFYEGWTNTPSVNM